MAAAKSFKVGLLERPIDPAFSAVVEPISMIKIVSVSRALTDAQIARVQELHARIDERRRALLMQERQARGALREEVTLGDSSRNGIIAQFMDQLFKSQRERLLLTEEEQKQLAQFLTPLQRAKYFALEESVRRLLSQMMQQAADSAAGRGGRGNPPA